MDDIRALTADAACTWEYIDRLRMAFAAACKERDELKASNRQVTETLRRNGFETLEELLAVNNQPLKQIKLLREERDAAAELYRINKAERDAAVKCCDDIREARVFRKPAYVVDELLASLRERWGL